MNDLGSAVERIATDTAFSGVVRVEAGGDVVVNAAFGLASRSYGVANTVETRFGLASVTKAFTALAVVALIDEGVLRLDTPARSILGADLPLIRDDVTVEHLLAHRSGIGDYIDEDLGLDSTEYVLSVPVSDLVTTENYVPALDGHPPKFAAGERFSYCNGGYVVLAVLAERASGVPFSDLVDQRVTGPAGMTATAFLRSDELLPGCATGYLAPDGLRTNVFYLPVVGSGDGGIYSTTADLHTFWTSLFAGRIVSPEWVARMTSPLSDVPSESARYGLGFWLDRTRDIPLLVGQDAGVSAQTVHDPAAALTYTVLSNTEHGAWPLARHVRQALERDEII